MIRIEYTVDGKTWNHLTTDHANLLKANEHAKELGLADYAKKIRFMHFTKVDEVEIKQ